MKHAEIFFEERGDGPCLVLVHGWGLNAAVWAPLLPLLETDFRVLTLDLPGHGRSAGGAFTLAALADVLHGVVREPAVWLGWSLGAMAVLALALRQPAQVRKLVLVGATAKFVQSEDWPAGLPARVFDDFAAALAHDYERSLQRFLSLQVGARADRALLHALRTRLLAGGRPSAAALNAGLALLRDTDLRPRLGAVRAPALILQGERDRLVSLAAAQALQKAVPQSALVSFPAAGHAPFLSCPQAFAARVRDFIHA